MGRGVALLFIAIALLPQLGEHAGALAVRYPIEPDDARDVVRDLALRQSLADAPLSLDDVVLTQFLNAPGYNTMPIEIFGRARLGLNPSVNTVATLTVAVVSVCVLAASIWMSRAEKRRALEMAAAYRNG